MSSFGQTSAYTLALIYNTVYQTNIKIMMISLGVGRQVQKICDSSSTNIFYYH